MATQHPDNAQAPYWDKAGRPQISAYQEMGEAVICFRDLGVSEYMWDWEGKHADAAVIDRLFSEHLDYFTKHQLGRDKFLTFRIPNIWEEKGYNLMQAMTVILSSEDFARDLKLERRPLFEVILPMTERANQLTHMQDLFQKLAHFKSSEFTSENHANTDLLEMIPLVESVESQQSVAKLLNDYVDLHKKNFGKKPDYIRPFLARSDPALVSGLLATVIANKLGLSRVYEFAHKQDIEVYPISGVGSLPFRGGLAPDTVDSYLLEYPGMRTASIQSSFRYDHPIEDVKKAISRLESKLPKTEAEILSLPDQKTLQSVGKNAAELYQGTLSEIARDMQPVFEVIPKRRDRRQHIGLLAYGRKMGSHKMPRAITFTAGFYSIGVPPEFIGFGRALKNLSPSELQQVERQYKNIRSDLTRAGAYLNLDNLNQLAKKNSAWKDVITDVEYAEDILGLKFGFRSGDEHKHQELSTELLQKLSDAEAATNLVNQLALLRKSLG
ncbi:MAG: phosphoenolpyruvate carboxylase [Candidatus Saccharimonadales bacterium]